MTQQITEVFDPPLPTDSAEAFDTKAFGIVAKLNPWATEANALAVEVNDNATAAVGAAGVATTKASEASSSASAASSSAGAAASSASSASGSAASASGSASSASSSASSAAADRAQTEQDRQAVEEALLLAEIPPMASQPEMEAGTEIAPRSMSPQRVAQAISALGGAKILRDARTSNAQLAAADKGKWIDITSGTFTQTFAAAAALGDGWWCYLGNSGAGNITIPTSDGRTNWVMYPGEVRLLQCDAASLRSVVLNPFRTIFTASATFIKPPGYKCFDGLLWAGGGGGARNDDGGAGSAGGGGGGACVPFSVGYQDIADSLAVVIASGGAGANAASTGGQPGGISTFGPVNSYGGGGGIFGTSTAGLGGGGGGALSPGASTATGAVAVGGDPAGGRTNSNQMYDSSFGGGAGANAFGGKSFYGGGGGVASPVSQANAGNSVYGGGGGGGIQGASPSPYVGISTYGGNGGNGASLAAAQDGFAPGGGGGAARQASGGAGARGELRVWGVI